MATGLAGWSQIWKEYDLKIGDKKIWERGMWIGLSEKAKNMKVCVSYVNVHQRVTSAEDDFNNQVDKVTCSEIPVSIFPQPPLLLLNGLKNKVAMVGGMKFMHGLSNMDSYSPRPA